MKQRYKHWVKLFIMGFFASSFAYFFIPKNVLTVSNQPNGTAIRITRASLAKDGFVIMEKKDEASELFTPLGESDLLQKGTYTNIHIKFMNRESSAKSGEQVYVTLYTDTGDKSYSSLDFPVRTLLGKPLRKRIRLY